MADELKHLTHAIQYRGIMAGVSPITWRTMAAFDSDGARGAGVCRQDAPLACPELRRMAQNARTTIVTGEPNMRGKILVFGLALSVITGSLGWHFGETHGQQSYPWPTEASWNKRGFIGCKDGGFSISNIDFMKGAPDVLSIAEISPYDCSKVK